MTVSSLNSNVFSESLTKHSLDRIVRINQLGIIMLTQGFWDVFPSLPPYVLQKGLFGNVYFKPCSDSPSKLRTVLLFYYLYSKV